jgi:hypothetical protein
VWIGNNDSYISNGLLVSKTFNIVEPTNVKLNYLIKANWFKVTFLPNEQHPNFNHSSSNTPTTEFNRQPSNQVIGASTFNPAINNINSLDFNFHGEYTWEKIVTTAQASKMKNQTLVCRLFVFITYSITINQ